MKPTPIIFVLVAAMTACAPVSPAAVKAGAGLGQTTSCINLNQVAGRRVLADGSLLFEANGPADYRNRLASQCPGAARISRSAVISILEPSPGNQLCRGDRVRVLDSVEIPASGIGSAPTCFLADFELVPRR